MKVNLFYKSDLNKILLQKDKKKRKKKKKKPSWSIFVTIISCPGSQVGAIALEKFKSNIEVLAPETISDTSEAFKKVENASNPFKTLCSAFLLISLVAPYKR